MASTLYPDVRVLAMARCSGQSRARAKLFARLKCLCGSRILVPAYQFQHWNSGRKKMTAMNVQGVCGGARAVAMFVRRVMQVVDGRYRFMFFGAGWGGSEHDSTCWRSTPMDVYLADRDNAVGWNTTASFMIFDGAYRYVCVCVCVRVRVCARA